MFFGVGEEDIFLLCKGCQLPLQFSKVGGIQNFVDRFDPVNPFWMAFRREMVKGRGMGV